MHSPARRSRQNPDFKESIWMINSNLMGHYWRVAAPRDWRYAAGGRGNWALRTDFKCDDMLRAILGKYYTIAPGSYGFAGTPGKKLVNYGSLTEASAWNSSQWPQIANVPLTFNAFTGGDAPNTYIIRLDNDKWNALTTNVGTTDFLKQVEYEEGSYAGDPNWRFYLRGNPEGDPTISSRFAGVTPIFQDPGPFIDNTFFYRKPSNSRGIREECGIKIDVASTYNFYADTTPPYEDAISTLPEPLLPNFYCMESELRNTGSIVNNVDYIRQIKMHVASRAAPGSSLENNFPLDEWFEQVTGIDGQPAGITESTSDEFYSLYAASANSVANSPDIAAITADSAEFKNCVILCSDLKGLNKLAVGDTKSTGLINVPFYNTLTLGLDDDSMNSRRTKNLLAHSTGETWTGNFFRRLKTSQFSGDPEGFKSFMDILQMRIIQKIEAGEKRFAVNYTKWTESNIDESTGQLLNYTHSAAVPAADSAEVDFSWKSFLHAPPDAAQDRINQYSSDPSVPAGLGGVQDNLLLLRDYNSKIEEDPLLVEADVTDVIAVDAADSNGDIAYPTRNFNSVLRGESCYSETILYKVDKSLDGNVVQTFYISARNGDWQEQEINYIDTQIKYGRKYTYDIKQIKLVYGNRYTYENLQLYYSNIAPELSRGIGRALGIYRSPGQQRWDGTGYTGIHEVLDNIIKQAVDPSAYIPDTENPPVALEQTGYFIWRPQGSSHPSWPGSLNEYQYKELFHVGTNFRAPSQPNNDTRMGAASLGGFGTLATSTNPLDGIKMTMNRNAAVPAFLQGDAIRAFENILQRPPASSSPVTINVGDPITPPVGGIVAGTNIVAGSQGRSSDEVPGTTPPLPPGVRN